MRSTYGTHRVMEPSDVLPTSAWRVDNSREIAADEMRIAIKRIHIEITSFKQICLEAGNDDARIREKITDIVIKRGKLHNPVTDTGGLLYGVVEEIGDAYENPKGLREGDEVLCNVSLATVPLYISRITRIDRAYGQIEAEGYAIAFSDMPMIRKPEGLPVELLLFTFNESGTLYKVGINALEKKKFLVVGNNLIMNLLFGYAVRKVRGEEAEIVCLFDKKTDLTVRGKSIDALLSQVFDEIHYVNILRPMDCMNRLHADSLFDVSINCVDIPGAETINILATKSGGTVFFANLINNYNIALYITESISRQLDIRCADGYLEAYDAFDIELVRELAPYFENAVTSSTQVVDDPAYPLNREQRIAEASGHRKTLVEDFICESRAMAAVLDEIMSVAKYDCNVLITGDTGVGKEKVANIIQKNSSRMVQPFIKINCASIAPNLMESEFFGYEKGSFTGANLSGKKGYFEAADNGTIFLDEIGELPTDIQAKLLRVIQDGEFFRVGGTEPVRTNVRILSATNRNLEEFVEQKRFRRDLYYRLNVFPIRVPDLAERKSDIPALVQYFIKKYNEKFGIGREINEDAVEYLARREWPGNIRELENVIQRLLIAAKGENITLLDVKKELHTDIFDKISVVPEETVSAEQDKMFSLDAMVDNFEKSLLEYACQRYGSTRKTARAVGISQTQLVRKKKKYGIETGNDNRVNSGEIPEDSE